MRTGGNQRIFAADGPLHGVRVPGLRLEGRPVFFSMDEDDVFYRDDLEVALVAETLRNRMSNSQRVPDPDGFLPLRVLREEMMLNNTGDSSSDDSEESHVSVEESFQAKLEKFYQHRPIQGHENRKEEKENVQKPKEQPKLDKDDVPKGFRWVHIEIVDMKDEE